jgi:hypothetical protein
MACAWSDPEETSLNAPLAAWTKANCIENPRSAATAAKNFRENGLIRSDRKEYERA